MKMHSHKHCLLIACALLVFVNVPARSQPPSRSIPDALSLTMKIEGYFRFGSAGWSLNMDTKFRAHLTIDNSPQEKTRTFHVTAAQIAQLRKAAAQERFFTLAAEYGSQVADGSTRTLTIRQGKRSKTVTLYTLSANGDKLSEVKRALRVWNVARHWFDDAEAVNLEAYDQRILNVYEERVPIPKVSSKKNSLLNRKWAEN